MAIVDIRNRVPKNKEPIRLITTGAMQRRFSESEEVAIDTGNDPYARVIKSRLINANYCDLDFEDTQLGLGYICNFLSTAGALYFTTDPSARLDMLLVDGINKEAYRGTI